MIDLGSAALADVSQSLQAREVSAAELVRAYLARIEALEPRINSYITVLGEQALAAAAESDRRLAGGEARGPLEGVPLAVKDLLDVVGAPTSNGIGAWRERMARSDAEVVRRLKAAGAVILGKLNMHECALGGTNDNPHFGKCRNPWQPDYVPGGSSGGSGASVAAGLCAGSLGTDNMGSVRIPAAFCGIAGLKPTNGLVGMAGMAQLSWSTATIGPMCKGVDGVALLMGVLAGDDPGSPYSRPAPQPLDFVLPEAPGINGLRVGVLEGLLEEPPEADVAAAFDEALRRFADLGAELRPLQLPEMPRARLECLLIIESEGGQALAEQLDDPAHPLSEQVHKMLAYGRGMPTRKLVQAHHYQFVLRNRVARLWREVDVLLAPVSPLAPFRFEQGEPPQMAGYMPLANLCGLPGLAVPMGFSGAGLPIGMQIVGAPFADAQVLAVGKAYETTTDWHLRQAPLAQLG
jgi:aspartyl-tRNA(Asn)/glutamyl-tRNA(Gln) amidotransferase subunit A